MKGTYQPFILKIVEEVFEELKDDITPSDESKEYLCDMLTQKFIDGKLSEGDGTMGIFESEKEIDQFVKRCLVNDSLDELHELGLIGTFDDGKSFFITEEGKKHVEQMKKRD